MTQEEINQELKNYKNITWEELKTLQDNSELTPGQQYRITDYICTTTQDKTRAQNHQFDIIVIALSSSKLDENARAIQHDGDTYFTSENLSAWELKYCLDNDTSKYAWVDATNGRGVIWYMKDDSSNECYYDFKNIQMLRDADFNTEHAFNDYVNDYNQTVHYGLTAEDYYYYTFTYIDTSNTVYDLSLSSVQTAHDWGCFQNAIQARSLNSGVCQISLNVFCGNQQGTNNGKSINNNIINGYNNTFGGRNVFSNTLECLVYDNFFADAGYCYGNHLQGSCYSNKFNNVANNIKASKFYSNTFKGKVDTLYCLSDAANNVFEGAVSNLYMYSTVSNNNFKGKVTDCHLHGYFANNTLQQIARLSTFGHFQYNTINAIFGQSTVAMLFSNNTINQNFLNNTVLADFTNNTVDCYFRDNVLENNIKYVHFNGDSTQVNNYHIYSALQGTSSTLLEITPKTSAISPRGLAQKEDSTVLDWGITDNLITSKSSTELSVILTPNNNIDIIPESELTINLQLPSNTETVNIYTCTITIGDTIPTITFNDTIVWDDTPEFLANSFNEISIRYTNSKYYGVINTWLEE